MNKNALDQQKIQEDLGGDEYERRLDIFLAQVRKEVLRARTLFPNNQYMLHAMQEEAGEVTKAMLEHEFGDPDVPASAVVKETVQTAAMAARVCIEGDMDMGYIPPVEEAEFDVIKD